MKVSTKGRYALRLMVDLAQAKEGQRTPIKDISERQGISEKYLEQIVRPLSQAGFVRSVRGAQGGYLLTDAPENFTVGQVLRVMEGDLAPVDCVADEGTACLRADNCATMFVWRRIKEAVDDVVDNITIADLVAEDRKHDPLRDF